MKIIKIVIELSSDHYSAYAENVAGVYGAGETAEKAKKSIIEAIELLKQENNPEKIPAILKGDYAISYKFDVQSLLNYYKGIFSNAAFERITGINQKQIQHYGSGHRTPRPEKIKRMESAIHDLGRELLSVEL